MSGLSPRSALKLCDAYADMSREAQRWTDWLRDEPHRAVRVPAMDTYVRLVPSDQHALTLFVEIAASEKVWFAEEWMNALHEHNAEHPNPNRRATWEAV